MIKQAIIPLAGQGTRLLPLTSVFAKELLPINGRPGVEYILDECIEAGIKEIIFIISQKKLMIKKYFYSDTFYKNIIKKKKDPKVIEGSPGACGQNDHCPETLGEAKVTSRSCRGTALEPQTGAIAGRVRRSCSFHARFSPSTFDAGGFAGRSRRMAIPWPRPATTLATA